MAQIAVQRRLIVSRRLNASRASLARPRQHLAWFAGMSMLAFSVPFAFTSVLDLQHDLYYGSYFAAVLGGLAGYIRATGVDAEALFLRNWKLSLLIGLAASAFVVWNVLAREEPTPRPEGAYFGFELAWRGLLYGAVDALLLSAFPAAVAYGVLRGAVTGLGRRVLFGALTTALVLTITAVYHLGYSHFREVGVSKPETGNTIISFPAIVSLNPLGSLVAHTSMHAAAVVHAYETETFLPPRTAAD